MVLEMYRAEERTMIHRGRRLNERSYNILSTFIVIVGMVLLIGGLCILVIGLFR